MPVWAVSILAAAGHDVSAVLGEQVAGRPDEQVAAASATAARVLGSLDVGPGGPCPCRHQAENTAALLAKLSG